MKQQTTAAANGNRFIWNEYEQKIRAAQADIKRRYKNVAFAKKELSEASCEEEAEWLEEALECDKLLLKKAIKAEADLKAEAVRRLEAFARGGGIEQHKVNVF